jgi:hypothetical protein
LSDYVDLAHVRLPDYFSHAHGFSLGMLGNDRVGDCVIADMCHRVMIFAAGTGRPIPPFSAATAVRIYSDITGYNPNAVLDGNNENPTDQGTDMEEAARWWRHNGIPDDNGVRHPMKSYGTIETANWDALLKGSYLFGAIALGVRLPQAAIEAMERPGPVVWDYAPGSPYVGGHCITLSGRRPSGNAECVTWGRLVELTPRFVNAYMDECVVAMSQEYLMATGKSPELFDEAALDADLLAVSRA